MREIGEYDNYTMPPLYKGEITPEFLADKDKMRRLTNEFLDTLFFDTPTALARHEWAKHAIETHLKECQKKYGFEPLY